MASNTNLFGCCSGDKSGIIREYQLILAKLLVEDVEFFYEIKPGLDINEDFLGEAGLRMIVGTLVDMRARYDSEVTYDSLEIEVLRKVGNKWDVEEVKEYIKALRDMELSDSSREMCKEQFNYWKQFVIMAKIANITIDMVKEPWFVSDGKLKRMIEQVRDFASELSPESLLSTGYSSEWI